MLARCFFVVWFCFQIVSACVGAGHFVRIALTTETDAAIFSAQSCPLANLVPLFSSLGVDFGSLGGPWMATGAAERTPCGLESDF